MLEAILYFVGRGGRHILPYFCFTGEKGDMVEGDLTAVGQPILNCRKGGMDRGKVNKERVRGLRGDRPSPAGSLVILVDDALQL